MVKKSVESYGDLYIPMHDVSEKRKNLLLSIKNSLIMQEEQDKIMAIRAKKSETLKEIKKELSGINTQYLKVKKFFPNIKNILSNTEKEISLLESQIQNLKTKNSNNQKQISKMQDIEKTLQKEIMPIPKPTKKITKKLETKKKPTVKKVSTPKTTPKISTPEPKKPLTKKERVKANLKALESKLQHL